MQREQSMARPKEFPLEAAWLPLLSDFGVRPASLLRRAELPDDLFVRAGVSLSTEEYFRLWQALQVEVADPLFPLHLARVITAESFMPPLFAALCSPNLTVAAVRLSSYKRLIAPMALDVASKRGELVLTLRWLDAKAIPPQSLIATELAIIVRLARIATREPVRPLSVVTANPPQPAAEYAKFFGVAVKRGKSHALTFSRADAERPFLTASEAMWKTFEPELRRRLAELDADATTAERVHAVLLESLPSGQTAMEAVARRLGMSKRTLQRRLGEEGTTFSQLLGRTREELARHYLVKTSLSCTEISFLLGFDEPSSFFRAFHEWTGRTPEAVRQLRAG